MADPVKPILKRIRGKFPWRTSKISTTNPQTLGVSDTNLQPSINADNDDNEDLWKLAYNELTKQDPELVKNYGRKVLSLKCIDPNTSDPLSSPESIQDIVSALAKAREDKQWQVTLGPRQIKVRAQVEKLVTFALGCESIVGPAAKSQPYSALAWSGVSVFLSLLSDGLEQAEVMLDGFNYTCDKQRYWRIYEKGVCQIPPDISAPLMKLYAHILKYQLTVISHLSKKQVQRAWNSKETWEEMRLKVERQDKVCQDLLGVIDRSNTQKKADAEWKAIEESPAVQREIRDSIGLLRSENQSWRAQEDKRRLLENLSSDCDYERGKNLNPPTVTGTCEWFFNHEKFKTWRDMDSACILWLSAGPGCGKSVLSRALIDDGKLTTDQSTSTVCYFFFKEGDPQRTTSTSALSAILHQLFTLHPNKDLINCALDNHNDFGKNLRNNFLRLWNILLKCAEQDEAGEIVCLIDALDECKEDECKELIDCIIRFYEMDTQDKPLPRLKLLVIGRPYDHISKLKKLSHDRYFCVDNNNPSKALRDDISLVIQARTEELTHFDDGERQEIVLLFEEKRNCTYLWFTLMFNIIESTPSAYSRLSDIRELLAQIPPEIDDAYEHILGKVQDRRVAMKLFQIVIASPPLHIKVLNTALTLAIGSENIKSYEDIDKNLYKSDSCGNVLRNLSGLFLVIEEGYRKDYVYFIHRTAREFLLANDSANSGSNRRWKGSLNEEDAHSLMFSVCRVFLQLCPDQELLRPWDGSKVYWDEHSWNTFYLKAFDESFAAYAAKNWHKHYKLQSAQAAELTKSHARICCLQSGTTASFQLRIKFPMNQEILEPFGDRALSDRACREIYAVVAFDLLPVFLHMLRHEKFGPDEMNFALQSACLLHRSLWVQKIIDNGASPSNELHIGQYSLFGLCSPNYRKGSSAELSEIVDILLSANLSLDWLDSDGETELHKAAFTADCSAIQFLFDFGANIGVVNNEGNTPLHSAVKSEKWRMMLHVVEMLCAKGVKLDAENSSGSTALGIFLDRIGKHVQDFNDYDSYGAAESINLLLASYGANTSHPSVSRPLELLMARKDLPKRLKSVFDKYKEHKEKQGII